MTGVLLPFSARMIFRVRNATKAEREILVSLDRCHIRRDREFFNLAFKLEVETIEVYLREVGNEEACRPI